MPSLRISPSRINQDKPEQPGRLTLLLRMAGLALSRPIQAELSQFDLSYPQFLILTAVSASEGAASQAGLQKVLREDDRDFVFESMRLVDRGLLTRHVAEGTPPQVCFLATDLGRSCLAAIDTLVLERNPTLQEMFSPEEWAAGLNKLAKVYHNARASNRPTSGEVIAFPS